jgi:hypothetical protein
MHYDRLCLELLNEKDEADNSISLHHPIRYGNDTVESVTWYEARTVRLFVLFTARNG